MSEDDGLQKFLAIAAQHPLLTATEEKALGRRVQSGTVNAKAEEVELTADAQAARNELVQCNIRLVISVARYYRNRGLAMDDVVQNGIIGLNRAAEKFDPVKEIRFSTYATLWIKQAIQRGLTSGGAAIRLPSTVAGTRAKVRGAQLRNPEADHSFIADLLDLDVRDVERALDAAEVVTSLDRVIATDEHEHTLLDAWPDDHAEDPSDVEDDLTPELREALRALDRHARAEARGLREKAKPYRKVLELHFGIGRKQPLTVAEIAARTGLSTNTVKTLRADAIEFLGHYLDHHR